jgi:hypothetical protein
MSRKFPQLEPQLSHSQTNAFAAHGRSQLMPSVFDRDGVAPHQYLPD